MSTPNGQTLPQPPPPPLRAKRKKVKKNVTDAVAHIHASFNNTIILITDRQGNTLSWATAGSAGFKGSRKSHAVRRAGRRREGRHHAPPSTASRILKCASRAPARAASQRCARSMRCGFKITNITDVTPIPHNGCRSAKRRRV